MPVDGHAYRLAGGGAAGVCLALVRAGASLLCTLGTRPGPE